MMGGVEMDTFDLIVGLRGGLPECCDFCGQAFSETRHPVPEEAGERACSECVARWDASTALIASEAARKLAEERLAKAVEALGACIASLERADTSEDVCCCGDNMDGHSDPMACGHVPVDMGDYYAQSALKSAHAILKEIDNG